MEDFLDFYDKLVITKKGPIDIYEIEGEEVINNDGQLLFDINLLPNNKPIKGSMSNFIAYNKLPCYFVDIKDHNNCYGYVYMIINNKTGKKYIGRRKIPVLTNKHNRRTVGTRWEEFNDYWGSCVRLNHEMKLEGKENYTKIVLEYVKNSSYDDEAELALLEMFFITLLTLKEPDNYNNISYFRGIFRDNKKFEFFTNFCANCYKGISVKEELLDNHYEDSYYCKGCYDNEESIIKKKNNFINVNKDLAEKIYYRIMFEELKTPMNSITGDRVFDFFEEFLRYSFINMETGEIFHNKEAYFSYMKDMII